MKKLVFLFLLFINCSFSYKPALESRIIMTTLQPLSISVSTQSPSSATSKDGSIRFSISGGQAPYTIQVISTFSPSKTYTQTQFELKKIGAGTYTFIVQDEEKHVVQKIVELVPVP